MAFWFLNTQNFEGLQHACCEEVRQTYQDYLLAAQSLIEKST